MICSYIFEIEDSKAMDLKLSRLGLVFTWLLYGDEYGYLPS